MASADILYAADGERAATTNAWAFLHWLGATGRAALEGWAQLQRFSAGQPDAFAASVAAFAGLPATSLRLVRRGGRREALVLRAIAGSARRSFSRDQLASNQLDGVPPQLAGALARQYTPAALIPALADLLLFADLRPDDRLLAVNLPPWPWLVALLEGTTVVLAPELAPARLLAVAAEERANVVAATASTITTCVSAWARSSGPATSDLRAILATGGPLPPPLRRSIYADIKPDLMLLACSDDTPARFLWGSPLDPVLADPPAAPGFFRPPPEARETA